MPKKTPKSAHRLALVIATEEAMVGMLNRHCQLAAALVTSGAQHEEEIVALNAAHDLALQADREELAMIESSLQLFAVNNRGTLFPDADKKSKEYSNATIGFRDNPPSVAPMIKGEKDDTLALRLSQLEWGDLYMDWKPVLNKKQILADRLKLTPEQLQQAGIMFKQEEQFYIAPKADSGERIAKSVQEVAA